MIVLAPLWFLVIVMALTHPLMALKYGLAFAFGGAIGLCNLALIIAAYGG